MQLTTTNDAKQASEDNILVAARGGGIAFTGNLFVYLLRFAFGIVITRLLGAELFGYYSLGMVLADVAGTMALLGFGSGIARFIAIAITQKDNAQIGGVIQIGLIIPGIAGLVLGAGTYLGADLIAYQIYNKPELAPILRLISIAIPLFALMVGLEAVTQGFKRMEYKVYSEDISLNVLKLILTVGLIGAGLGVRGAIGAYIIALAATVGMLFAFVNRLFPFRQLRLMAKRNVREMFHFTLPVYISQLVNEFSGSISTLILGFFGAVSGVGVFTAALRISAIGTLFHTSLMRIASPMIADLHNQGKIDQLHRVYQTMTRWGMTFNLPIFLTTVFFSQPLLSIFGDDFISGSSGLIVLAFAALFNASTGVCGTIVTMTGHSRVSLMNSLISLVTGIGLSLLTIPKWGLVGAAAASALCVILMNLLRLSEIYYFFRIWPYNIRFLKPITAALVAATAILLASPWLERLAYLWQFLAGAALLWTIYIGTIVLLKFDPVDRLVLGRFWARFSPRANEHSR